LPRLAKQLGESFFNDRLLPICITWLNDSIFSIREASLKNLYELTVIFGSAWTVNKILPKLLSLHVETNYLHRLTPLFGIATLATTLPPEVIRKHILPVIATLAQDSIPNIRMNVAKTI